MSGPDGRRVVIGIDPGSSAMGACAMSMDGSVVLVKFFGLGSGEKGRRYDAALSALEENYGRDFFKQHDVIATGIETAVFVPRAGMRGRATTLESRCPTYIWSWRMMGRDPLIVDRASMRRFLGVRGTSKADIVAAVRDRYCMDGFDPRRQADAFDAVAVAGGLALLVDGK